MSLNRKFLIFYFLFLSVIIFINQQNKIEINKFLTKSISPKNDLFDFDSLTIEEKEIWNEFTNIPKKDYRKRYKDIVENNRKILLSPTKNNIGITILKRLLKSNELNTEEKLFVLEKLSKLQTLSTNVVDSITTTIEMLHLAERHNSKDYTDKSIILLSSIISNLDGNETAIDMLNKIPKSLDLYPTKRQTEVLKNFNLFKNYFFINDIESASASLNDIDRILDGETNEEYIKNTLAFKYTLEAQIGLKKSDKEFSRQKILDAKILINEIHEIYFPKLLELHMIISEAYNLEYDFKNFSEKRLKTFIDFNRENGDRIHSEMIFSLLFKYYSQKGDFKAYEDLKNKYDSIKKIINAKDNEVLTLFLINSLEKNYQEQQNSALNFTFFVYILFSIISLFLIKKYIHKMKNEAEIDYLTKIKNRKAFTLTIKKLKTKNYYMLLFDIDNFKSLNDTYGHQFGDIVLERIGNFLEEITSKQCIPYRIGGEEFALLFINMDNNLAKDTSEFIRRGIEKLDWEHDIKVTISGGFSAKNENTYLICDKLLYEAKKSGKNIIKYK